MVFYDPEKVTESSGVFIYALSTCVHCKHAKKFLDKIGVKYDFVDVDRLPGGEMQECLDEMSSYNPSQSFPTIVIGKRIIVGAVEDEISQATAKLHKTGA